MYKIDNDHTMFRYRSSMGLCMVSLDRYNNREVLGPYSQEISSHDFGSF